MTALRQIATSNEMSPYMPRLGGSLEISSVAVLIEKRNKEVIELKEAILSIGDKRKALSNIMDVLFDEAFPMSNNINVSKSGNEISKESGFRLAQSKLASSAFDIEMMINKVDARYWRSLMQRAEIDVLMSSKQCSEWEETIDSADVPAFDMDNIQSSIEGWRSLQGQAFIDRIEAVWESLSGDHATNSNSQVGEKMIFKGSAYTSCNLSELRSVVRIIEGRPVLPRNKMNSNDVINNIERLNLYGTWQWIDGSAIAIKVHKNGNLHVKIHPIVVAKMNDVLAMRYPKALPAASRCVKRATAKKAPVIIKADDMLPWEVVEALGYIRRKSAKMMSLSREEGAVFESLPSFAYIALYSVKEKEVLAVNEIMEWIGAAPVLNQDGAIVGWRSDVDIIPIIDLIAIKGGLPNVQSYQFYPSKGDIGEEAADLLHSSLDDDGNFEYCEPHGGHGDLAKHLPLVRTKVVELSPVNALLLKTNGYDVHEGDFLDYAAKTSRRFDGILMNPPFNDGQAYSHTNAALGLLKEKGVLVAIIPSSAIEKLERAHSDKYAISRSGPKINAFEGVNVVVEVVKFTEK